VLFWLPSSGREATVRHALASETRWATVPLLVATASPALGRGPTERAWLPLAETWPRRRLIELAEVDHGMGEALPSSTRRWTAIG
jgi:hypothetical protein